MSALDTSPVATREFRAGQFFAVLRSESTKFSTVRGWLLGLLLAFALCVTFTFLGANGSHEGACTGPPPPASASNTPGTDCHAGHPFVPTGPNGGPVADSYEFVARLLTADATITTRLSSLTGAISTNPANVAPSAAASRPGLAAWAKAGILLTPTTRQGSRYAAVVVTGDHGVRFQYDYTHDRAGLTGAVTSRAPRWLRLTRKGDTVTGYDSADGARWSEVGTARFPGLPAVVDVGMFATSPVSFAGSSSGFPTLATATFDHVTIDNHSDPQGWHGQRVGTDPQEFYPTLTAGSYFRSGGSFVVSGSGDIAPGVAAGLLGTETPGSTLVLGLVVGLIVMLVLATMFVTSEYRRGLIRTTFAGTPNRGSVLAAKALAVAVVAFATTAFAATVAITLGEHILEANGNYVFPVSSLVELRIITGSGVLVAVSAAAVVALGTILRTSAAAICVGLIVFVLPLILGSSLSGGAQQWLFRLTPAAGFSVLAALPYSAQVSYPYTLENGYYPLAPWSGLAVLCAYAALALGTAWFVVRRRDA